MVAMETGQRYLGYSNRGEEVYGRIRKHVTASHCHLSLKIAGLTLLMLMLSSGHANAIYYSYEDDINVQPPEQSKENPIPEDPTVETSMAMPKVKKWTSPESISRAKVLYNYLLRKGIASDILGKRIGDKRPITNFRFFTPGNSGSRAFHGAEFLGKRGLLKFRYGSSAPVSEFLGKRSVTPDGFDEKFQNSNTVEKRKNRMSEFLGKRMRASEFLGKRNSNGEKRFRASEFLGKRGDSTQTIKNNLEKRPAFGYEEKRDRVSEFLGKRSQISEFLGKRFSFGFGNKQRNSKPRGRVSEFLGKRSGNFTPNLDQTDEEYDTYTDEDIADMNEK